MKPSQPRRHLPAAPSSAGPKRALLHDLASPLAVIRLSAHTLRANNELGARNLADLHRIEEAAGMISRMIASLDPPRRKNSRPPGTSASNELVDLYAICCELASARRAAGGRTIHCRAFGDPRGGWDRRRIARAVGAVLDYTVTHIGNDAAMTIIVTGMAHYVRVDVHGIGWLSANKRQNCLRRLAHIGSELDGVTVTATFSPNGGSIFTLRLPR
jgi:hypothetical protein